MRRFGKAMGRLILAVFIGMAGVWAFAPQEPVDREISFDTNVLPDDLDAWIAQNELQFSDIRPGAVKRIVWAAATGQKTPLAVVYVHGFSAAAEEIRPVPDEVAKALGANLFFTRLAGHGRTGEAMAEPRAGDWIEDMAEAMAIARRLGDRVVVISTSTGGTLAVIAAADPVLSEGLAGVVLVSPNFGVKSAAAKILDLPLARHWGPWLAGANRSFKPLNDAQARHWTTSYPTTALFPMAALVRHARALDYGLVQTPALVIFSPEDQVVDPEKTKAQMAGWGGPVRLAERHMGAGDDPFSHVIAGAAMSPGQTAETVTLIVDWVMGL